MTREELVKQKADSLGQMYFPNANNVWARANLEAQYVSESCIQMAEWEHKRLVEKACEWIDDVDISKYLSCIFSGVVNISFISDDFIRDFKKAMEE